MLPLRRCLIILISAILLTAMIVYALAHKPKPALISLFPLQNYDQNFSDWIKPTSSNYNKPLLSHAQQKARQAEMWQHYFGDHSPWNSSYVTKIFSEPAAENLYTMLQNKINHFSNKNKPANEIGYGVNFRPYSEEWIHQLKQKINLAQFTNQHYKTTRRAIAITNTPSRELPTDQVYFYNAKLAGEGYPFDNLQSAVIWAGTPLYVLGESRDHAWSLVLTPSFSAWIESNKIAFVSDAFIKTWQQQAAQNFIAITNTQIPIIDQENKLFRFEAYIGMLFPGKKEINAFSILIPIANDHRQAIIHHALLKKNDATATPLIATPKNFISLMQHLIGRPYGWGGMYFFNDCASELKNLFTPFGIWIPMQSSEQAKVSEYPVKVVDLSSANLKERLNYLQQHGHKFMTIVYIGGHVYLYLGNYVNPLSPTHETVILSYQNLWGLHAKNATPATDRRAVIGQSLLLPILPAYPEDQSLMSPADKKYFQLIYLDEITQGY